MILDKENCKDSIRKLIELISEFSSDDHYMPTTLCSMPTTVGKNSLEEMEYLS